MTGFPSAPALGAVLLAGGRASRLDGADKPGLELGGISLLARAVRAVRDAGAAAVTVVGPARSDIPDVRWVREDPPFTGPAAALVAALTSQDPSPDPEWTLVLAADLSDPAAVVARLVADLPLLPADTDGVCLGDAGSRPQWLTGAYRTRALRTAALAVPDAGRDAPVRAVLDDLSIAVLRVPDEVVHDIDTWQDLEQARRRYGDPVPPTDGGPTGPEEDTA
jgi:molybdopterin-guanine dinucleotide biosynthesis protein A